MASSPIEICNSALTKIGAELIVGFTDNSKTSDACKERYEACKRTVLRLHPWNCAIKRVSISPLTTAPVFGFAYVFNLPADCLRILVVNDGETDYKIEGRQILADDSILEIKYVFDMYDNVSILDEVLVEAIALRLAWDICYKITQSATLKKQIYDDYKDVLRTAKVPDSQEEPSGEITADYFLESRLAGVDSQTPKRKWPA